MEQRGEDFNFGFCSVYTAFTPANCGFNDTNPAIAPVKEFRNRVRNGLYHLGYTKSGLWLHNDDGKPDFEVVQEPDPNGAGTIDVYRVNPHSMTRSIISHFPGFVSSVRTQTTLQTKFIDFIDTFHAA